jgi:hypothetical protein
MIWAEEYSYSGVYNHFFIIRTMARLGATVVWLDLAKRLLQSI